MNSNRGLHRIDIDPDWLLRIFTIVPALIILLTGAGAIWMYFFVVSLLPSGQSTIEIPELTADVRVVRDKNGIPGILAQNEQDLGLVLGYVMAQDRLWQMDYLRRASDGRLAEILGPDYVDGDHLARILRVGMKKAEDPDSLNDAEKRWLESFVVGVNRYLASHVGKLPVEFSVLEYRPEPFSLRDVLGIFTAVAWESSAACRVDPVMTLIYGRLGGKRALQLFPSYSVGAPDLIPSDLNGWEPKGMLFARAGDRANMMRAPGFRGGCVWAVDGARTRSGKPMVGCVIYQVLSAPGFWYRARLMAQDFHLSGAFVPGLPVAIVGNNPHTTWACASAPVDDADLYVEILDSDNPSRYWKTDQWKPIRHVNETYRVKGGRSFTRPILLTENGPIVSDPNKERAISLRWTGQQGLGFFSALYSLNRAKNKDAIRDALKSLVAPGLNVAWADEEGNYGIQLAGKIPVRPPESDGILPMPGWTGVQDWRGFVAFEELPSITNPSSEIVCAADNDPGARDISVVSGWYWNDDSKQERIKKLLTQSREHNSVTFQEIQTDALSPIAQKLTPVIIAAIGEETAKRGANSKALEVLRSWDFRMDRGSAGAALFGLIYQAILEELLLKPLGKHLFEEYTRYDPLAWGMVRRIWIEGRKEWLGGVSSDEIIGRSFEKAVHRGKKLNGGDPSKWKWGDVHTTVFYHPLTARSRFLEWLYHVGPLPVSGAGDTVDFAAWSKPYPFHVVEGVSLRQVSDMSSPPEVHGISTMGSSAHFFSRHYKDQTSAWLAGRTFRVPILKADITKQGFDPVLFKSGRTDKVSKQ